MVKNDENRGDAAEDSSVRPTMVRRGCVTLGHKKRLHFREYPSSARVHAIAPIASTYATAGTTNHAISRPGVTTFCVDGLHHYQYEWRQFSPALRRQRLPTVRFMR